MSRPYVELAPGVYRIPHIGDFLNSFIVTEADGSVTLIDCGLKGGPKKILRALEDLGRHPHDVQRIVLTHAHSDHAGGAAQMVRASGVPGADAHADDHPFLSTGMAPPINAGPTAGRILNRLQDSNFEPVPMGRALADGEILDIAGGMQVVHTPGHTPGHISLLIPGKELLLTGDCIMNPLGRRIFPFGVYCVSPKQNAASASLLGELEYSLAAFTHGTEIRENPRERIRSFLTSKGAL
jgi:glyoxylase-like metal-dependent hydrolase (beta-lactamase superfamily II)